jgi:hypothetical protein
MPLHAKYVENLERSKEFEDFVFDTMLHERRLVVGGYKSRHYQTLYGESATGVEVKFDGLFRKTGNLFIEIAETYHESVEMKPAGIYHASDPWLMVFGDYAALWAIATSTLRSEHAARRHRQTQTGTSAGFLLPLADANRLAAFKWEA